MSHKQDFMKLQKYVAKLEAAGKSAIMLPMCRVIIDQELRLAALERKLKK